MHCEYLFINDCSDWKAVETICESLPELDIVSTLAFIVEAINTIDGRAFVITSEYEKVLWVFYLVSQQQADGLKGLLPSINVVTQKEVISLWRETTVFKEA